jgi:hypothetical protein
MPANFLGSSSAVDIDGLLSHTTQFIDKKGVIQDAIADSSPFLKALSLKGRFGQPASGGTHLEVPLMYGLNSTFGSYSRAEVLNTAIVDGMGAAFYPWAQYAETVSIDGLTALQNAGAAKIKDIVASKFEQATMTIGDGFNKHILACETIVAAGATGNGGKNVISLPMLVDYDPDRNVAVGGINPSTYSWWENQVLDADNGTTNTPQRLKKKMQKIYTDCAKQGMGGREPDLVLMSQQAYLNYLACIDEQKRYSTSDKSPTAGFGNLMFNNAEVIWDMHVPDPEAGYDWDSGSYAAESMYFLNSKSLALYVLGGRDWKWRGWMTPHDQDAKANTVLWAGQLAVRNRRSNGLLYGINSTEPTPA